VVTGWGTINGRLVFVFSQDFTVFGGSLSEAHAEKICKIMDQAMQNGAPVIGLNDSGGARIQEGVASLAGYAEVFQRNVLASGVVPQISRDHGPLRRRRRLFAGHDRLHLHGEGHVLHVRHRPRRGEDGDARDRHARGTRRRLTHTKVGRRRLAFENDVEALLEVRRSSTSCRSNRDEGAGRRPTTTPSTATSRVARHAHPRQRQQALRHEGADPEGRGRGRFLRNPAAGPRRQHPHRLHPAQWAARRSASSPTSRWCWPAASTSIHQEGGALRALLRLLQHPHPDLVDVPGFLPGVAQEYGGIIKHGAKLLFAYAEATVPKVTVITRKAYGGAYDVMASKHLRGDVNFAWPTAEIAVMGPRARSKSSSAPSSATRKRSPARTEEYRRFANPFVAGRTRLHRRRHHAPRHPPPHLPVARDAARQEGRKPLEEARQHPAVGEGEEDHVQEDPHRQPRRDRLPRHQDRKKMGIKTVAVYSDADATRCM
jgi:propionyl-CoA carboxylase beta chain